jgi:hypothetical protein
MEDVFDPDAEDGTRFDVFAFWRYDVDTGADVVTSTDFTPAHIPTKQHIIHSRMADVTPSRVDHPWGYLEIPADAGAVHANNRNPAGSIVVRVTDTEGDPEWEAIALLPVASPLTLTDGKHPDVMEVITWGLVDQGIHGQRPTDVALPRLLAATGRPGDDQPGVGPHVRGGRGHGDLSQHVTDDVLPGPSVEGHAEGYEPVRA